MSSLKFNAKQSKFRLLFIVFAASIMLNFTVFKICTTHARCWNSSPFASLLTNTVPMSSVQKSGQFVLRRTVQESRAAVRLDGESTNESGFAGNLTSVLNSKQRLPVDIKTEANSTKLDNVAHSKLATIFNYLDAKYYFNMILRKHTVCTHVRYVCMLDATPPALYTVFEHAENDVTALEKTSINYPSLKIETANCVAQSDMDPSLPPCYVQNSQCMQGI